MVKLKQFVGKLPTNCLSVFDQFVGLAFKGLKSLFKKQERNGSEDEKYTKFFNRILFNRKRLKVTIFSNKEFKK